MANNCVITSGLTLNSCVNNTPGISDLWVLTTTGSSISLSAITYAASGEISAMDSDAVGVFRKVDLVRNSAAVLSEEVNVNTASLSFTFVPSLQFQIPGWAQEYTELYQELVKSVGSVFIVKLKSGKYFLASPSGMYIETATINSGSVPGDSQLYDLVFTGDELRSIPEMDVTSDLATFLSGSNLSVDRE